MSGLHSTTIEETKDKARVLTMAKLSNEGGFVKAMDRKARSYLETIKRSLSSSSVERCEDPTSMTIEFLWGRLQAERAKYEAEKLRSQQLNRKIQELEQKLNFENESGKKTDCQGNTFLRNESASRELQHLTLRHLMSEQLSQEISLTSLQSKENVFDCTKDEDHNSDVHSMISSFDGQCMKCSCCDCHCHFNCQKLGTNCQRDYSLEKSVETDTSKCNRKLLVRSASEGIRKKSVNLENDEYMIRNMNTRHLNKFLTENCKQDTTHQKFIEHVPTYSIYDTGSYSAHKPLYSDLESVQHISRKQNIRSNVTDYFERGLQRQGESSLGVRKFLI